MKFTGLHPHLLMITVKQHGASDTARYLFTLFVLLLTLVIGVFELVQLIVVCWSVDRLVKTVPNVMLTVVMLQYLFGQYVVWSRHPEITELFNDWSRVELQSQYFNLAANNRFLKLAYNNIFLYPIVVMPTIMAWIIIEPDRSFFFTYYSVVRENVDLFTIAALVSTALLFSIMIGSLTTFIAVIAFHHAALIVSSLAEEWNAQLENQEYMQVIWQKYERILHLVDRTNKLFGTVLLTQCFHLVLAACLSIFYVMEQFQKSGAVFSLTSFALGNISLLIIFNWILSQLYFSTNKLKKLAADVSSRKWHQLGEAERHLLVILRTRLNRDDMAVRPMNLFHVNPTNLLSILGMVLNYIVVLAQSR